MTFGEKIHHLRKMAGLSQEQLAEKLGVSRQAISRWEMGTVPDMENAVKISKFFDCSLDYLVKDEVDNPKGKEDQVTTNAQKNRIYIFSGVMGAVGALGLLILGILSSVCPAVIYDPPQGEVRAVVDEGFSAFLKFHHLTWLFILCCGFVLAAIILWLYRKKRR